jgi:hypothetical protein
MIMAQQNNRNNLRTGDMRSAHVKLGCKFLTMYSNFGIGEKLKKYGSDAEKLKKALDLYRDGTLGLRLRPASASANKELEKQNDILISDRFDRYYQSQAQIIQAINSPGISPDLKQYYLEMLLATRISAMTLARNFNRDNPDALLPDVSKIIEAAMQPQAGAGNGNQQNRGSDSIPSGPSGAMAQGGVPAGDGIIG